MSKKETKEVEFKFNSIKEMKDFLSYLNSDERKKSVSDENSNCITDADYQNWRESK